MVVFPRIAPQGVVDAADRASAVDYVNRVNWLFETWDLEAMIAAFTPDAKVHHFHGYLDGEGDIRRFLTDLYPYLIPGVSRHAANHIVDAEAGGTVAVRYQNLLVRFAWPEQAAALGDGQVLRGRELPAPWLYSPMLDRLRRTEDGGWKICERYIGGSAENELYAPRTTDPGELAPFMPVLAGA